MLVSEICQALVWAGLGDWNNPEDTTWEYEAYGDGKVSMVYVLPSGVMRMADGNDNTLWEGEPEDDDQILDLLDKYGHYAAC